MVLLGITILFLFLFIGLTLYINNVVNKSIIKDYGYLATLNSVWSTSHGINEETAPWDPIFVKIINNKSYKKKRYVTYMELESGDQMTCELAHFLSYFTFRHS